MPRTRHLYEKQLLVGLDEYTAHADVLAEPLPHALAPVRGPDGEPLYDPHEKPSAERDDRAGHDRSDV